MKMDKKSILVVEDNPMNMKLVRSLFKLTDMQIIEAIEAEKLIESHPKRHPGIRWQQVGDSTILHKKGKEDPFCRLNRTGTIIWNACNGTYSPWDLAHIVHCTFQIDAHQAYVDCLCFLALLNAKGAIQL